MKKDIGAGLNTLGNKVTNFSGKDAVSKIKSVGNSYGSTLRAKGGTATASKAGDYVKKIHTPAKLKAGTMFSPAIKT